MQYAIISDTHDNFYNLERVIRTIKEREITQAFHLGDFCAPSVAQVMAAYLEINWVCVFGNVDGDKAKIVQDQAGKTNFDIVPEHFRDVELPEEKIFLSHYSLPAELAAQSGSYKACFHGHTHVKRVEKLGNGTLLVNPGEVVGFKTGQASLPFGMPKQMK